ncbi:MAG: S-adenosylmethionine:tRNA ribosyltransferase-isomerase [Bacteroidota bacterium]
MTDPKEIRSADYTYALPDERIARFPLEERDASKLLVYEQGSMNDLRFTDLPSRLESGDLLVFNRTKVIHARLLFQRPTGSIIEIFCLEPHDQPDPALALQQRGASVWKVLVGNLKRWKEPTLQMNCGEGASSIRLTAELTGKLEDALLVRFSWNEDKTFAEVIESCGRLPIPPYLGRDAEASDELRYQTVYADREGSVAAPTAGLHFTQRIFDELRLRNIQQSFVTLHVGAGTFRPLKSETVGEHAMHDERIVIDKKNIETLLQQVRHGKRIVAVGTTSLRTLESLYWLGVSCRKGNFKAFVDQWDPYTSPMTETSTSEALSSLLDYLNEEKKDELHATTRMIIVPGYRFRLVDAIITNFHQPSSTLLLLVAAFVGPDWKEIYRHALNQGYRFLSYGDSSLLTRS